MSENRKEAKKAIVEKLLEEIRATETSSLNFVIPNFLSKPLRSYMLIREDLLYTRSLIMRLVTMKENSTVDAMVETSLWKSAVTTYAKNFTQNKGGMIKLDESDCFKDTPDHFLKTHSEIMDLRHSFIAHRDDTEHEQAIVYLKLPKSDPIPERSEYKIRAVRASCPGSKTLDEYLQVFTHLQMYVENKIQLSAEKVHKSLMENFSPEELKHFLI